MARQCDCAGGNCGTQADDVSRREFLTIAGTGAAATLLSGTALADWIGHWSNSEEVVRWREALMKPAAARVYHSDVHLHARMPLGGIGTGNFEIGCDGQFTSWQLFNTLRDGDVPLWFAVKAGGVSRLLQTAGGPNWPRVKRIEMTGEYPIATLRYVDPDLPVKLELSAFTPFAPLDSRFSSQPLAAFVFRVENPTNAAQTVSLAGMLQNVVGYDAIGPADPRFGGNVNEPFGDKVATGILMRAAPGKESAIDRIVTIFLGEKVTGLVRLPKERPDQFHLVPLPFTNIEALKVAEPARSVLWLEEAEASVSPASLRAARRLVEAGATLVFSGPKMPLVESYARHCGAESSDRSNARPDIVFDDFENGYMKNWKVEGKAFGREPAAGTLPGQQPVTGFQGKRLANSFVGGDDTTGRLVGRPFTIERNYIHFLIGGGRFPTTQLRLLVDGKVVRAASGKDDEHLTARSWDVREWAGKQAHLEIVDQRKGPWGHICVDDIVFSDEPGLDEVGKLLADFMPARFTRIAAAPGKQPFDGNSLVFENLVVHSDAKQLTLRGGHNVLVRPFGKGQVVLASGAILAPKRADWAEARHRAYQSLCELAGAQYTPPQGVPASACGFGTLALAALGEGVTVLPAFDDWNVAWTHFQEHGKFSPEAEAKSNPPTAHGRTVNGAVAVEIEVPAGGSVEVPFLFAWRYPNSYQPASFQEFHHGAPPPQWLGCHYATLWDDARAAVREAATAWPELRRRTETFRKTFYDSTLPYWMLDCVTSQAATARYVGVVFRTADGIIYGWEGSNGCCAPTCTHVWGYEQSLARLFPDLEKIMRKIDFKHQQLANGGVNNRTHVPSPPRPSGEHPFADGHASCVLKAYREALNHPDESFFKEYWPNVKRAVEYLIDRDAATAGGKPQGVLLDDQFNTYDEDLHGVTSFISGYYLAALRAGEEWAKRMGDEAAAGRFREIFLAGRDNIVRRCWNGEYFEQDLPDYMKRKGEVGPGCMADQLIGQWWAHQLALGYILPKDKVQCALRSVFKYNWVPDLTGFKHSPRAFAGAKDKGLLICTWPKGGRPPEVMLYSDEVWTGIEYQVAAHMIYEGLVENGLAIVCGARDRYNGIPKPPISRSPWNEIECGGHYARAMSSWSLLLATAGFCCDGPAGKIAFAPNVSPERFKAFFTSPEGWGTLEQFRSSGGQRNTIRVVEGILNVSSVRLSPPGGALKASVTLGGAGVPASLKAGDGGALVTLASSVVVKAGETLAIALG